MAFKNMRRNFKLAILMLFVSVNAMAQSMQKLPNGTQYSIIPSATTGGTKIKLEDVITFNFIQKTDKDSVLMSSYQSGQPVKIQIVPTKGLGDLMDVFTLLSAKDSAIVRIPTDSIFVKETEQSRPPFLPKGSSLVFHIKIERVQTLDEAIAESKKLKEDLKAQEKASLASYIASNNLSPKATPSGLMYMVTTPSVKPKPRVGDTVYVNYIGRTLDGKVFDTSIEAESKKAGLERPGKKYEPFKFAVATGEVIKGWDEGLLLFNEGSKGTLILQSDLAYGEQSPGEAIPPYSTLIFDVELVKVKRPKVTATTPALAVKKPVVKTTQKPVVKPVKKTPPLKPVTKAPVKK